MVLPWNGIETDVGISIVQTILLLAIIDYTGKSASPNLLQKSNGVKSLKTEKHKVPGSKLDLQSELRKTFV